MRVLVYACLSIWLVVQQVTSPPALCCGNETVDRECVAITKNTIKLKNIYLRVDTHVVYFLPYSHSNTIQ